MCMYAWGIKFASFYDFSIGFGTVPTVWYFLSFIFFFTIIVAYCKISNTIFLSHTVAGNRNRRDSENNYPHHLQEKKTFCN